MGEDDVSTLLQLLDKREIDHGFLDDLKYVASCSSGSSSSSDESDNDYINLAAKMHIYEEVGYFN